MIFEVTPEHVEKLDDGHLRILIGQLAECEVAKNGHSPSSVTYGGNQNAKDGGVDVRVTMPLCQISGYVPRPNTGFQVKAEKLPRNKIFKEMRPNHKLRDAIRELGEASGAYVIVSSRESLSDNSLHIRTNAMAEAIADEPTAADLSLHFYDNRRVASWVNQNPGLIVWLRTKIGEPISGWRPYQDWSSSPAAEDSIYALDDAIRIIDARNSTINITAEAGIQRIRALLRTSKGVVRLLGLSGVGKTRLAQALFDPRIGQNALDRQLAVYCDVGENTYPNPVELIIWLQHFRHRCILVLDNCSAALHRKLTNTLTENSPISFITIEHDVADDEPERTNVFKLEPASSSVIEKVLKTKHPHLTDPELSTITNFSDGNFRIALALANTSGNGTSLANLKDKELIERLIWQGATFDPALLRAAKVCSIVYSFAAEVADVCEAEIPLLAKLAGQSETDFHGHIAELRKRKLIQARSSWRALLPQALAHHLAKQALEEVSLDAQRQFLKFSPPRLVKSFSRRLGYLHDSLPAQKIVDEWLDRDSILFDLSNPGNDDIAVLSNIAPVRPEKVLRLITQYAKAHPGQFSTSTYSTVIARLLRSLAYDAALFDEAVGLLFEMHSSQHDTRNDGEILSIIKSMFYACLSGTHAPALQRADFVRRLLCEGNGPRIDVALTCLKSMLECRSFTSIYDFEFGARKRDYGFLPDTLEKRDGWYGAAFELARDLAQHEELRAHVRSLVASQFRHLASRVKLDDVILLAEFFASNGGWPEGWVGVRAALDEAQKSQRLAEVKKLRELESKLAPATLSDRIAVYVLPEQWGAFDIADVEDTDANRVEQILEYVNHICDDIGREIAADPTSLNVHICALIDSDSSRVQRVARVLGLFIADPDSAWALIESCIFSSESTRRYCHFPGSFLGGLAERDRALADAIVDRAYVDAGWHPFLPHFLVCIGLDCQGTGRLLNVIPSPALSAPTLAILQRPLSAPEFPEGAFLSIIDAITFKEGGVEVALDILHIRIEVLLKEKYPIGEAERRCARTLLKTLKFEQTSSIRAYRIARVVRWCLVAPDDEDVARVICRNLRDAINFSSVSISSCAELVKSVAALFPLLVLDELAELRATGKGLRRPLVADILGESRSPFEEISDEHLLSWARVRPETRYMAVAEFIVAWHTSRSAQEPVGATNNDEAKLTWTPLALQLIREAPEPAPVLARFESRLRLSAWAGQFSGRLVACERLFEQLRSDPDTRISKWVASKLPALRAEIIQLDAEAEKHHTEVYGRFES